MEAEKRNEAKDFLKQVKLCDIHINNKIEEKARLESLALKITSSWSSEHVSGSGNQDKVGEAVAKIADMEREIDKAVDEFIDKKNKVKDVLEQIQNPDQLDILYKRYFQYETFEQIASEMNMTYRNICIIHGKALQSVTDLMKAGN